AGLSHGKTCKDDVLFLFSGFVACPSWRATSIQCRSDVFKVNVHFVQLFSVYCSFLFSCEAAFAQ
ncbi:hypothetical protein, partial [Pseudomonas viridiflava]|uniref:hypothetical protein n=1 Tax=Pseudomonas viridiflava TaxID=33069 RepID=UPI001981A7F7